ncbi:thermolysin metallopeptidase-like protein [Glaciihabitans tibetensis]|uniref:Neutral metalloproteinase n=1 Tax=Glaciihabitans tibetensis TaxID=1266600 RepID=A0A2T0VHJ4_9MICO|nr:M4 family metallopeptidase [Glaciihabitans tibetensis]PRY69682.1 thermolysin metallopeptidase-like protein [Glaciihabitans tibetensis]
MSCMIIPPYLLQRLAGLEAPELARVAAAARASLARDQPFRGVRSPEAAPHGERRQLNAVTPPEFADPQRTIFDTRGTEVLPGEVVRREGDPAGADPAVNEAYDGLGHTHAFLRDVLQRASIDGNNLPLDASVHFGDAYDNAFWDGERMVFGDGDGVVFTRMTASLSVIGHELAHGVTQYTANLRYEGQSGALNESFSDVIGALVEQHTLGHDVEEATWLIGLGLFTDAVEGDALRSMRAPGTAYDDDVLGRDPQPAHMRDYVDTREDNGGVHLNSGIPNHAFYLVANELGGFAWERAGRIWYDALTEETLPETTNFTAFAEATTRAAAARFGEASVERDAVIAGWRGVGITADG